jgi:hypothetical protein
MLLIIWQLLIVAVIGKTSFAKNPGAVLPLYNDALSDRAIEIENANQ